jgi:hypothetical protein
LCHGVHEAACAHIKPTTRYACHACTCTLGARQQEVACEQRGKSETFAKFCCTFSLPQQQQLLLLLFPPWRKKKAKRKYRQGG